MTRSIMVWGTTSGAGKSLLVTALARLAARRGIDVAPFKAQNMSNNARVVPLEGAGEGLDAGWGEIGSAQYLQARAARCVPHTGLNPVLLKPESDTRSQVVVDGRVRPDLAARPWRERSPLLAGAAEAAFRRLAARHELIVIEGAGSPAEINLADVDYVNLGAARWARAAGPTAALLVSDIDRGGAFAHLHGTWALLPADLQPLLEGFVLNRFRGDAALLAPGPEWLERRTGVPVAGVLPMARGHGLPEEDGLLDAAPRGAFGAAAAQRRVAVIAPPGLSNLDEFEPLAHVPGVTLRWVRDATALDDLRPGADWIVLPGSKHTAGDLAWLRARGLDAAVRRHAEGGGAVLGICGGLQMLGRSLHDPAGHDGACFERLEGLGLLPLTTEFVATKRLHAGCLRLAGTNGPWQALDGVVAEAYEIHCGHSWPAAEASPVPPSPSAPSAPTELRAVLHDERGAAIGWQCGPVLGLYAHGLFESDAVLQALFGSAGAVLPTLDARIDAWADLVEAHLDRALLARWLGA